MTDQKDDQNDSPDPAGEVVINPETGEDLHPEDLPIMGGAVQNMMDHLRRIRESKKQPNLLDNLKAERERIAKRLMSVDKAIELVEANPVVLEVQQLLTISEQ